MVSSHLTKNQDGFFQMDWEIAVPAAKAEKAMQAIKKLTQDYNTCLPLVGVFIRFAPIESKSLLAHTVSNNQNWIEGETAVFFEMPVYIPQGFGPEEFDHYEKQYQEFASMLIRDFNGRPHWGKNKEWTFDLAIEQKSYGNNINDFYQIANELDPNNIFQNNFSRRLFKDIKTIR
jgi:FAD/FMN-containing dehydrogenase